MISKLYVGNLFSILLLGVLASGWILYFTDWFEVVGGLLALGGVLSWLAFVSKIIPEDRLKEFQTAAEKRIFANTMTPIWVIALFALLCLLPICCGTIELETRSNAGDYLVKVHRPGEEPAADEFVSVRAGSSVRSLHLGFGHTYVAHVRGYPVKEIKLGVFDRQSIVVPDSFARPVMLVRPDHDLVVGAIRVPKWIEITLSTPGATAQTFAMPFEGSAIWVGCDDDVEVPAAYHDLWQRELERKQLAMDLRYWLRPKSLLREATAAKAASSQSISLSRGQNVEVKIFRDSSKAQLIAGPFHFVVTPIERWEDFPQVCDVTSKILSTTNPSH